MFKRKRTVIGVLIFVAIIVLLVVEGWNGWENPFEGFFTPGPSPGNPFE